MKIRTLLFLAALGLLAFIASRHATASGPGLAPDSYVYVAQARSLLAGDGVRLPAGPKESIHSAHFPPLFAGLLAVTGRTGLDPIEAAGWLNAALFGANVILVGVSIWQLTGGSASATLLGSAFTLGSESLVLIHAHVWSEPTFYLFALLGMLLLVRFLERGGSMRLVGASLAVGLALLTRYAGFALIAAGIVSLLWSSKKRLSARLREASLFLALSAGPAGVWMLQNWRLTGSLTDRALTVHPIGATGLLRGIATMAGWVVPSWSFRPVADRGMLVAFAALLTFLGVFLYVRWRSRGGGGPLSPFALFSLMYLAFLLVSLSFFDAQTSLDTRILSPVFVTGLIALCAAVTERLRAAPARVRRFALIIGLMMGSAFLVSAWRMASSLHGGAHKGYVSETWTQSRLLQQVDSFPDSTLIYSNGHDLIYLFTGKRAIGLPKEISPNSLRVNARFEQEVREMGAAVRDSGGLLVYFDALVERRWYLPSEQELQDRLPLERVSRWQEEGTLYRIE